MTQYVLFGAGDCGRQVLAAMRKKGVEPVCFADNNYLNFNPPVEGLMLLPPDDAKRAFPDATWIVTIYRREAADVRKQVREMGVKTEPLSNWLPLSQEAIPFSAQEALRVIADDTQTALLIAEQLQYRRTLNLDDMMPPDDLSTIYFPHFLSKIDNEVFVDCGAYDGDTVEAFLRWQPNPELVRAIEADPSNFKKLCDKGLENTSCHNFAVSDHNGVVPFMARCDVSSSIGVGGDAGSPIEVYRLDRIYFEDPPTFIKMDIEGHEPQAIWGARRILKEHRPVLAICAYHEPSHLWEIPLLVHAIQPNYHFRLRRYAEGAQELVWFAVPEERLKQ